MATAPLIDSINIEITATRPATEAEEAMVRRIFGETCRALAKRLLRELPSADASLGWSVMVPGEGPTGAAGVL